MKLNRAAFFLTAVFASLHFAPALLSAEAPTPKKILFFSKSSGFEHSAIKEKNGQPSYAQKFPGLDAVPADFGPLEEWYSLKDFAPNLHVLLVQETSTMKGNMYQRAPYPATWARMHGKGRVFYTNMGHREDVWDNPIFQKVLVGGINWAVHNVDADVTPNMTQVTPKGNDLPPSK